MKKNHVIIHLLSLGLLLLSYFIVCLFLRDAGGYLRLGKYLALFALVILGCSFLMGGRLHPQHIGAVAVLMYLALLSAVAYTVWSLLLKVNPVSRIAVFMFLQPVFGVLLSLILYGSSDVPLLRYAPG